MKLSSRINILSMILCIGSLTFGDYDISWYSIDGGGASSSAGDYTVIGSIGQPDAGQMSGEDYSVEGGFFAGSSGCVVNLTDLSNFMYYWLDSGLDIPADIDDDGVVDNVDFSNLAYYWLDYCPAGWELK